MVPQEMEPNVLVHSTFALISCPMICYIAMYVWGWRQIHSSAKTVRNVQRGQAWEFVCFTAILELRERNLALCGMKSSTAVTQV